jgi:hypothetical protein
MRHFLRNNGLSLVLAALFLVFLVGQVVTGWQVHNDELAESGGTRLRLAAYLVSGHFLSATFENWESEFLQMAMYVLLTVTLRQRGSAESRPLDQEQEDARIEAGATPWPARAGGWVRTLYGHSLAIAFGLLCMLSLLMHAYGSWRVAAQDARLQGRVEPSLMEHAGSAQFWFESFQNWQSEFLAVLAIVVLSIWLRQKDSPQSKPVDAPHTQTGT